MDVLQRGRPGRVIRLVVLRIERLQPELRQLEPKGHHEVRGHEHGRSLDPGDRSFAILSEMKRTADPYRDLDVIDARAPRFNQATIGVLAALAVATGWWWLLGLLGLQLLAGLTLGRRFCLPCLAYFELVQPRFGEGPLEDARPPRFANLVGAVFLTAATVAYATGLTTLGAVLGGIVAALALLAAATGFCTGCEAYKLGSFLLGRPFISCPLPPR